VGKQLALVVVALVAVLVAAGQLARAAGSPPLRNDSRPTWSSDARFLAFDAGGTTASLVPVGHGGEHRLLSGIVRGWRPGGDEFLVQRGSLTEVVASDGRVVAALNGTFASWSPDGGRIAYVRDGALYASDATGDAAKRLFAPVELPTWELDGPVWSPDGSAIALATTSGLRVVNTDGSGSHVVFSGENQSVDPSWSHHGTIAFERDAGPHWSIWSVNADGTDAHALLASATSDYRFPQYSPTDALAFTTDKQHIPGGATQYQYALYVQPSDGSPPYRVLDDVRPDEPAVWSYSGAQLAAAAGEECKRWGVYVVSSTKVPLPHGNRRTNLCRFDGNAAANTLKGTPYFDIINGNGGNDVLYGEGGNDKLSGENGNDTIYGGDGNDFILAGPGNDRVYGGAGNDVIIPGNGRDRIDCGPGDDTVEGAGPLDTIARNCEHVKR